MTVGQFTFDRRAITLVDERMVMDRRENSVVFIVPNAPSSPPRRRASTVSLAMVFVLSIGIAADSARAGEPRAPKPDDPSMELSKLIDRANRIVVKNVPSARSEVLFESDRRLDLDELKASLKVTLPQEPTRCMCSGAPAIYLFAGDKQLGLITNQHGKNIRFDRWETDASLVDPSAFLDWLSKRGMGGAKDESARLRKIDETFGAAQTKWIEAMPPVIRPLWETALKSERWFKKGELREALARGIPDRDERIRAIVAWYGSGMGQWSGFPAYELFAQELLLEYPTTELVAAFQGRKLTTAELEGASRLFGAWPFAFKRPQDLALLPADLKGQLRAHCLASPDESKRKAAATVFKQD